MPYRQYTSIGATIGLSQLIDRKEVGEITIYIGESRVIIFSLELKIPFRFWLFLRLLYQKGVKAKMKKATQEYILKLAYIQFQIIKLEEQLKYWRKKKKELQES